MISGQNAFGAVLLAFSTLSLVMSTDSVAAKAAIVVGAVVFGLVAVLASRRLRVPSSEAIERVLHG
jgi:hypothetical protein